MAEGLGSSVGRVIGGQIVGGSGSAKRIDVVATALWNRMDVRDVAGMDLAYAPPFSPVWDPVLVAAGKAGAGLRTATRSQSPVQTPSAPPCVQSKRQPRSSGETKTPLLTWVSYLS